MKTNRWVTWGVLVSFFAYQFLMRVSPGVMADHLMHHFTIDALEFSLISTFYYIGYASMQLPIGILLDQYGPKIVTGSCIAVCVIGCLLFTYTSVWGIALLGRLLIGMGSSAGFISTSKALRAWFPENQFSRMVGVSFTIGLIGAINSGRPVSYLLNHFDWQQIMLFVCGVGGILALAVFKSVPPFEKDPQYVAQPLYYGLTQVFKMPKILILGVLAAFLTAPLSVFADVWGVSFFMHVYHWTRDDATLAISAVYLGMCFGAPLLATVANRFNKMREGIIGAAVIMLLTLGLIVFVPTLSWWSVTILLFIMGIFCCYQVLVFSLAAQMTPQAISGVVIGLTNMMIMMAGILFLPLVGYCLNQFSDVPGVQYSLEAYQQAFTPILAALAISGVGFLFFNPKKLSNL